jgi:hypothetical protein
MFKVKRLSVENPDILLHNNNIYELTINIKLGVDIDDKLLEDNVIEEMLNIGYYIRKRILNNSIINISDNDNCLKKENEVLNNLLQKKNIEILEMNNIISDRVKKHTIYLEDEIKELKSTNKYKENIINNLNEKMITLRENIKQEYKIEELILTNEKLLNEKRNNLINKIGKIGEERLYEYLLNNEYLKNYYKLETNKMSHSGDFCIYDEINNYGILIENKNYQYLVPREEVQKFKNDCFRNILASPKNNKYLRENTKINIIGGLFLSYKSGISEKKTPLDITIENNKILIYISEYRLHQNLIEDSILYIFNLYNILKDILEINDVNNINNIKDQINNILKKYSHLNNQLLNDVINMRKLIDNFELNLRNINNNIIEEIKLLILENSKKEECENVEDYIFNEVYNYLINNNIKIINVKKLMEEKLFKENVKSAQMISQTLGKYKEYKINDKKLIYNNIGTRRLINSIQCKNYFILE